MNMRIGIPLLVILLALAGSVALLLTRSAHGAGHAVVLSGPQAHAMAMSDADMAAMAQRYWATHARVGTNSPPPAFVEAVSDTVTVQNFIFDIDHNFATQIDTVKINVGDQVVWKWISGTHTVTSGVDDNDPQTGALFDQPMDTLDKFFSFTFTDPGTFPYHCFYHDFVNMKGVVVVQDLTGVGDTRVGTGIGFAAHPWPNPTRGAVSFRYDVKAAGPVRAEVFDAAGRRVATVVNETQAAGTYTRSWNGRTRIGAAPAGRYFVHLTLPGYAGTQAITLAR